MILVLMSNVRYLAVILMFLVVTTRYWWLLLVTTRYWSFSLLNADKKYIVLLIYVISNKKALFKVLFEFIAREEVVR